MKKNYIYFGVPILALVIFAVCYWNFASAYEQKEQDKAAAVQKAKKDKIDAMNRDREQAFKDATAANEKRKREKEAKEKADADKADAREQALEARNTAAHDVSTLANKINGLNKDVDAVKKEISDIEQKKKEAVAEKAFLATYVKQAQDNSAALESVLQKIKEADDAAAAAAKAAADAAKAAKK